MPDHWHALIWPPYPLLIAQVLHDTKKIMTLRLHARRGTCGPLGQHQYWDRFVRHEKEFGERLDYRHRNPVKKGLVKRPEDWRWSSYNNFALDPAVVAACPIQIDYVRLPLGYCAREKTTVRKALTGYPLAISQARGNPPSWPEPDWRASTSGSETVSALLAMDLEVRLASRPE